MQKDELFEEFKENFSDYKDDEFWIQRYVNNSSISHDCWLEILKDFYPEITDARTYSFKLAGTVVFEVIYESHKSNPSLRIPSHNYFIPSSTEDLILNRFQKNFPEKIDLVFERDLYFEGEKDFSLNDIVIVEKDNTLRAAESLLELFSGPIYFEAKKIDKNQYELELNKKKSFKEEKSSFIEKFDLGTTFVVNSLIIGLCINSISGGHDNILKKVAKYSASDNVIVSTTASSIRSTAHNIQKMYFEGYANTKEFNARVEKATEILKNEANKRGIRLSNLADKYTFVMQGPETKKTHSGACLEYRKVITLEENFSFSTFVHEVGHCEFNYAHKEADHFAGDIMDYMSSDILDPNSPLGKIMLDRFFDNSRYEPLFNKDYSQSKSGLVSHAKMYSTYLYHRLDYVLTISDSPESEVERKEILRELIKDFSIEIDRLLELDPQQKQNHFFILEKFSTVAADKIKDIDEANELISIVNNDTIKRKMRNIVFNKINLRQE